MRVTAAKLRRWGGCCDQVDKFYLMWPNGAEVTRANVALAQAAGLDVLWTFYHLMDGAQVKAFISYTVDQRRPWVAALLRKAGLETYAAEVEALPDGDMETAVHTYREAADAAYTAR